MGGIAMFLAGGIIGFLAAALCKSSHDYGQP